LYLFCHLPSLFFILLLFLSYSSRRFELSREHIAHMCIRTICLSHTGSYEQSPRLLEAYGADGADSHGSAGLGESQLREDLADAMMESPGMPTRDTGNYFMFLFSF
jgi:hypothetical protein